MSDAVVVCLSVMSLDCPSAGGHRWVYLNWALGFQALGCRVIWMESTHPSARPERVMAGMEALKKSLRPYGLHESVALKSWSGETLPAELTQGSLDLDAAAREADLLLNQQYDAPEAVVRRFRRSALLDIDPGLLQIWVNGGHIRLAPHDRYFTIGETVGRPGARFPDLGLAWEYTPPCVATDWWPARRVPKGAPFTTVSSWNGGEWMEDGQGVYQNDKRSGFLPLLDLPRHTTQPLELALALSDHEKEDEALLRDKGWRVQEASDVSSTLSDYQRYIQNSRGEFSCVKPSCVRLQNAWISDRTLCYLASGKPAIVQHTGPSRFLPDAEGLFRFRSLEEAAGHLDTAARTYDRQCRAARLLAEEHFDARRVAGSVLERAFA